MPEAATFYPVIGSKPLLTQASEEGSNHFLRHSGYNNFPAGNLQAIFFTLIIVFFGILIYDWIVYHFTMNQGQISTYSSYGRKLLTTAADMWDQRKVTGLNSYLQRTGRSEESLESMVEVLDSLSKAIHKWDHSTTPPPRRGKKPKSRLLYK